MLSVVYKLQYDVLLVVWFGGRGGWGVCDCTSWTGLISVDHEALFVEHTPAHWTLDDSLRVELEQGIVPVSATRCRAALLCILATVTAVRRDMLRKLVEDEYELLEER